MARKQPNVFVSMGTPYNDQQRAFRTALLDTLRSQGMVPRMLNQTDYPPGSPLPHIRDTIADCDGTLIVAYERKHVDAGAEKRLSKDQRDIANTSYTTPWNHIESALAYGLDKPLFIVCERNLRKEGLIEDKLDWYVHELDIDPARLSDPEFSGRLAAWRERLRTHRSRAIADSIDFADLKNIPVLDVARRLTVSSWLALAGAVSFLIGVGYAVARLFPGS